MNERIERMKVRKMRDTLGDSIGILAACDNKI
jgi:hypothetical protein